MYKLCISSVLVLFIFFKSNTLADNFDNAVNEYGKGNYETALNLFLSAIQNEESLDAYYYLGYMYINGLGTEIDEEESHFWFREGAIKGESWSQHAYGRQLIDGTGGIQDNIEGINWIKKSAYAGYIDAQYDLAVSYDLGLNGVIENKKDARYWYYQAAMQGDDEAQFYLGIMFMEGEGGIQDNIEGINWIEKSANAGNLDAMYQLGYIYKYGEYEISVSEEESIYWLKIASELGDIESQFQLGTLYYFKSEDNEALTYLIDSADQGHETAAYFVASILLSDFDFANAIDFNLGIEYLAKSAEGGDTDSQYILAREYYYGDYILQDYDKALYWFMKSVEQGGQSEAKNYIGIIYDEGFGVKEDNQLAINWYEQAIEEGSLWAHYNYGLMLYNGEEDIQINFAKAFELFEDSALKNHTLSQYYLGLMHTFGESVPVNLVEGYKWMHIAYLNEPENTIILDTLELINSKNMLSDWQISRAKNLADEFIINQSADLLDSSESDEELTAKIQEENNSDKKLLVAASGSGFIINSEGSVVTNNHVIDGCSRVTAVYEGNDYVLRTIARDNVNDMALLTSDLVDKDFFTLSQNDVDILDEITVVGYGLGKNVSDMVKVTKGIVSSMTGLSNNYSEMQIDAAIQSGNSGGPVISSKGDVVGIAVSKLDSMSVWEEAGDLPQNVNFAIKSSTLKQFLDANKHNYHVNNLDKNHSIDEIRNKIKSSALYLECHMTYAQIEQYENKKVMFRSSF